MVQADGGAENPDATQVIGDPHRTGAGLPPALAEGVQLIGEFEGSGYKEAPSLVRRADGQVIQLPPLLYSVAAQVDGRRSYTEVAEAVAADVQRGIDGDQVRFLVEEKLRPLGIMAAADGRSPDVEKADPFLALKFRAAVVPESASSALGTTFKPLFFPPLVLAVLATFVVADVWLFFSHGVAQSIRQALYHPGLFLPLFAAVVLSAAFHEIGHAAACRYGGGRPGKMGCGLYMAWPAFYTDVTDAYRLGRRGRLRTDLGGVYFNVVVVLATIGAYMATRFEPLLLLVLIEHLEIAHQLLPVIRLDGYYIVADLTGVPDLFARIGPILSSIVPGRPKDERVTVLKRWVRVAVTAWVVIVVPMLAFELLVVLLHLPRIVGTGWDSGVKLYHAAGHAFTKGDALGGVSAIVQLIVLAIPIIGIGLVLARTATGGSRWLWTHTEGKPVLRVLGLAVAAGALTMLLFAWVPHRNYQPIRPGERGTVTEGVHAVRQLASTGPLYSEKQAEKRGDVPLTKDDAPVVTTSTTVARATTATTTASRTATTVAEETSTTVRRTTTTVAETTTTARRSTTTTTP